MSDIKLATDVMWRPLTEDEANEMFDVLVELGGAFPQLREEFIIHMTSEKERQREFRFQGHLGFGGKFWNSVGGRRHVTCYPEDLTDERAAIIRQMDARLASLGQPSVGILAQNLRDGWSTCGIGPWDEVSPRLLLDRLARGFPGQEISVEGTYPRLRMGVGPCIILTLPTQQREVGLDLLDLFVERHQPGWHWEVNEHGIRQA